MTKYILLIAAVVGFIAQSSVYAADPTPAPTASASPSKGHHRKHHKKSTEPEATPAATATPKTS